MGTNSKARRQAKKKRDGQRRRRRGSEPIYELDLPGALQLWYALGEGEYADDPDTEQVAALTVFTYLARTGLLEDMGSELAAGIPPGLTVSGLHAVANAVPAEVRADLVEDLAGRARALIDAGALTRLPGGTVVVTEPYEEAAADSDRAAV